jgi:hypothetical protein
MYCCLKFLLTIRILTEAPFWAEIAAIPSALHALIGRYVIIGTKCSHGIQPLPLTQTRSSAEVGTQAYCRDGWIAVHAK